jgi:hypothetical protein
LKNHAIESTCQSGRLEDFLSKGNVCNQIININPAIWLKGSQLNYVAKKLICYVVLIEHKVKVNWSVVIFNNLYNRLWDLVAPTKLDTSKDNTKFRVAQMIDILLRNWFIVDLTLITP